jgi:hypothetical protein
MVALGAVGGNKRLSNIVMGSPVSQCGVVLLPDLAAARLNGLPLLQQKADWDL